MKRGLSLLLALVMLVSMIPAAAAAGLERTKSWSDDLFTDVEPGKWYHETVKTAYELDLMNGTGNGKFNPTGEISLAETIAIAARIHAIYTTGKDEFEQGTPWHQVYVDYALANGILSAPLNDYAKKANRLEFAHILAKALPAEALSAINTVEDGAIPDLENDADVYMLYRAGILTGTDTSGSFKAAATITRSEVAAIAARMADPTLRMSVTLTNGSQSGTIVPNYNVPSYNEPTYDEPTVDTPANEETVMDENNALTVPYDQAYPDLFASGEVEYSGEQILIKIAATPTGEQQAALSAAGVTALEQITDLGEAKWYKASVQGDVIVAMAAVRELPFVMVAEYDYVYETDAIVECGPEDLDEAVHGNDYLDRQWYLCSCGIKDSWEHLKKHHHRPVYDKDGNVTGETEETAGVEAGEGIVVAVIDTGVDYNHSDLAANIWVNQYEIRDNGIDDDGNGYIDDYYGWNTVANNGDPMDDHGHGTHVAGIIAAVNDDEGTVGIAYNAKVMVIKAGMASGYFNQSAIAAAIEYAYANGADVINMSFGGSASSIAVQDALTKAYTRSVLVAAAGNSGAPNEGMFAQPTYPAALSYVLGVMSVDGNGVESSFTNYDVTAFNSVEYEVYAPGSEMISTIPGNQYATWSGTSMAAPVVSAVAALVRSEYRDNNTYPTKFICGQISGTGEQIAICYDPELHGIHNLPKIVDVHNALSVLPKPEVGVTDYTYFDTVGLNGNAKNNGDGIIDAGETIAIGFTLRNRWGKSENTVISVDTLSQAGIPDPYITIHNASVNVGQVGTYSTQDCGKVMDGDLWIGWENPIYITVAANCPNDYLFNLNVTVTCENALDVTDTTTYSSDTAFTIGVRNGIILPSRIRENVTLTNEQLYVIPNDTRIMEGVTVTVEPGAKIQFWSDEPNSVYEDKVIAALTVEGTLLCNGTAENPIEMFPSERMGKYRVEIVERGKGVVKLYHTNIVNPNLTISYAENCEFTQKYHNEALYNVLLGYDYEHWGSMDLTIKDAKQCAFYRLGHYAYKTNIYYWGEEYGTYDECIFVDCSAYLGGGRLLFQNCVFYGNNNYLNEDMGGECEFSIGQNQRDVYTEKGENSYFTNNAIVNRLNNEDVTKWLRIAGEVAEEDHTPIPIDGNWWGTTNETLIEAQIRDFDDFGGLADLDATPYLTTAPENVWPFVVNAGLLDAYGTETVTVGNETVTFYVEFNRDMDTTIPLDVRFGSAYPYADYQVSGNWVSARRWEGTTTLTTLIEGGYQCWSIDNGKAADAPLKLYRDWGRFPFEIDTSEALAMTLQGHATETCVQLTWTQDDFDTLMGYNVYRADQDEDAYYQRLNSSVIPVGTEEFFDDTVEPGKDYYYIFTVVKTDLTESEPSGKTFIRSLDTMAPVMYHTPVYEAYVGGNIVINATVTDNLQLTSVQLHYSAAGGDWQVAEMQALNDRWSALISGNNVTLDGVRYYITATDGVSTTSLGSRANPYTITVKQAPTSLVPGDVNGDGIIGIADALLVLRAKNNKVVLNTEQFDRADWNDDGILSAAEALAILRYANGEINSLQ